MGDLLVGGDAQLAHQGGGTGDSMLVAHKGDGVAVQVQEGVHRLGVLLNKLGAAHHAAHGQGTLAQLVPLVGQGQGLAHALVLHHQGGGGGDGEHTDGAVAGGHLGGDLLGGHPLDVHLAGVHAVLGQQIVEDILGVGALAGGVHRLARQVGHGLDGVPLLQDIQHAQGVHGQHLDAAVGFGGQVGGHVGGHSGDIGGAVDQGVGDLLIVGHHGGVQGHGAVGGGGLGAVILHQIGCAHPGGAGQGHKVHVGLLHPLLGLAGGGRAGAGGGLGRVVVVLAAAAGQQGQGHGGGQQQRQSLFHVHVPFLVVLMDGLSHRTLSKAARSGMRMVLPRRTMRVLFSSASKAR